MKAAALMKEIFGGASPIRVRGSTGGRGSKIGLLSFSGEVACDVGFGFLIHVVWIVRLLETQSINGL